MKKKHGFALENLLNRLLGNHSVQSGKNKRRKSGRSCRIEELESREMLSVNMLNFSVFESPHNPNLQDNIVETGAANTEDVVAFSDAIVAAAPPETAPADRFETNGTDWDRIEAAKTNNKLLDDHVVWEWDAANSIYRLTKIDAKYPDDPELKLIGNLDLSGCDALEYLDCSGNELESLNVSGCTALLRLYCDENQLTSLDVSSNTALSVLSCPVNSLKSLNVSKNTALRYLYCHENQLTSLNLLENTALQRLKCAENKLNSLIVPETLVFQDLWCPDNNLPFSMLCPLLDIFPGWEYEGYADQGLIRINSILAADETLNLSDEFDVGTKFQWFYDNGSPVPFSNDGGVFTFTGLEAGDVIYCVMTNDRFPDLVLQTTFVTIISGVSDYHAGDLEKVNAAKLNNGLKDSHVTWEWDNSINKVRLVRIDAAAAGLTGNLDFEGCGRLKSLDCADNALTGLNVDECTALNDLDCSYNQLKFSTLVLWSAKSNWGYLNYGNQGLITLFDELELEEELTALASEYLGRTTTYTWHYENGIEIDFADGLYEEENGTFIFTDTSLVGTTIYCVMTNTQFLGMTLRTTSITVHEASEPAYNQHDLDKIKDAKDNNGLFFDEEDIPANTHVKWEKIVRGEFGREYRLTFIDASDNDLEGTLDFSGCTYLEFLDCSNSELTSLDLSGCAALAELYCDGNLLTELNLSGFTNLKILDCSDNQLTTLDVSGCTVLEELSFDNNNLTALDVSHCKALAINLNVENYGLTSLKAAGSALKGLNCNDNALTSLDMSGCAGLEYLHCGGSELTTLIVSGCVSLETLDCHSNQLTELNVSSCTALVSLNCAENQLSTLDVSNFELLETLFCSGNQLAELNVSGCAALTELQCYGNYLKFSVLWEICQTVPVADVEYVKGDKGQTMIIGDYHLLNEPVDLSSEHLIGEDKTETKYKWFYIDGDEVFEIEEELYENDEGKFTFDPSLNEFYIYCEMTNAEEFPGLTLRTTNTWIGVEYNKHDWDVVNDQDLHDYATWGVVNQELRLIKITANGAGLTGNLDFSGCDELKYLDVSNNELTSLDLTGCGALEYLNCSENLLESLDVSDNPALETLYCWGNYLKFSVLWEICQTVPNADVKYVNGDIGQTMKIKNYHLLDDPVDLSSEHDIDGVITEYAWFHADGTPIDDELVNMEMEKDGKFTFDLSLNGADIYSKMTNGQFPGLTLQTTITCVGINYNLDDLAKVEHAKKHNGLTDEHVTWTTIGKELRLTRIEASGAGLTGELDFSGCDELKYLDVSNNELTALDVSGCDKLGYLDCSDNQLKFSTLIVPDVVFEARYGNQQWVFDTDSHVFDEPFVDLAGEINFAETDFMWCDENGDEIAPLFYTNTNGEFMFDGSLIGTVVYCVMTNATFPGMTLTTTTVTITEKGAMAPPTVVIPTTSDKFNGRVETDELTFFQKGNGGVKAAGLKNQSKQATTTSVQLTWVSNNNADELWIQVLGAKVKNRAIEDIFGQKDLPNVAGVKIKLSEVLATGSKDFYDENQGDAGVKFTVSKVTVNGKTTYTITISNLPLASGTKYTLLTQAVKKNGDNNVFSKGTKTTASTVKYAAVKKDAGWSVKKDAGSVTITWKSSTGWKGWNPANYPRTEASYIVGIYDSKAGTWLDLESEGVKIDAVIKTATGWKVTITGLASQTYTIGVQEQVKMTSGDGKDNIATSAVAKFNAAPLVYKAPKFSQTQNVGAAGIKLLRTKASPNPPAGYTVAGYEVGVYDPITKRYIWGGDSGLGGYEMKSGFSAAWTITNGDIKLVKKLKIAVREIMEKTNDSKVVIKSALQAITLK